MSKIYLDRDEFCEMVAELSESISIYSCGCMGCRFTQERVRKAIDGEVIQGKEFNNAGQVMNEFAFLTDVLEKYIIVAGK